MLGEEGERRRAAALDGALERGGRHPVDDDEDELLRHARTTRPARACADRRTARARARRRRAASAGQRERLEVADDRDHASAASDDRGAGDERRRAAARAAAPERAAHDLRRAERAGEPRRRLPPTRSPQPPGCQSRSRSRCRHPRRRPAGSTAIRRATRRRAPTRQRTSTPDRARRADAQPRSSTTQPPAMEPCTPQARRLGHVDGDDSDASGPRRVSSRMLEPHLDDRVEIAERLGLLEPGDHGEPEVGGALAVDHAVVERDRDVPHPPDDDLAVAHDRPLLDAVDAEDRHLGMVDERRHEQAGRLAGARHRERAAAQLLRLQRARLRRLGEAPHLGVELVERARVAAADDRDDEPLLGLDGDADVVAVEQHELAVLDARVQLRELAAATRRPPSARAARAASGRRREKSHSSTQVTAGISRCARVRCSNICRLTPRSGSRSPSVGCRTRPPAAAAHVLLGDPPLRPGAGDGGEVDAELLRDLADERRRAHLLAV